MVAPRRTVGHDDLLSILKGDYMTDRSVRSGWLTDYFAQGMEGQVEWAFMDEAFADARGWDEGGILTLNEGDMLTVFSSNGATLWAGRIERVYG